MSYPPGGYGGPQQQGYPQPGYGGGYGGPVEHPQGTTILILGVLGIVLCQLVAPVAWIMANKTLEEIDRDPLRYSNRSNVNTGRILGMVGTIILILGAVGSVLYFILIFAIIGASGTS